MTKIAFFDIDGTMVNVPNGLLHPTEETKRVIQKFREQGNYVVVATGTASKGYEDITEYCEETQIPHYVIGDAVKARRAIDAIAEAAEIARAI